MTRAEENRIEPVGVRETYPILLRQTYRPADPEALAETLELIDRLVRTVKIYRLRCNMEISAAELSYSTMKEGSGK